MDEAYGRRSIKCAGGAHDRMIAPPRFRPIAPKPLINDPLASSSQPANYSKRPKRKYVRVRKNNTDSRRRPKNGSVMGNQGTDTGNDDSTHRHVATLQLLPEKSADQETHPMATNCSHEDKTYGDDRTAEIGLTCGQTDPTVVESLMAVESVEPAACCKDGIKDEEYWVRRLDSDTCPGIISDVWNNVTWVNTAYGRMVGASLQIAGGGCKVRLVVEDCEELKRYGAVTCWVRVSWRCTWKMEIRQIMVPCDAWPIDSGGFAWRLDVDAALSLGPCNQTR